MKIGYARISNIGKSLQLQINALKAAGCLEICCEIEKEPKLLNRLIVNLKQDDVIIMVDENILGNYDLEKHRDIFNKRNKELFISFLNPREVHEAF